MTKDDASESETLVQVWERIKNSSSVPENEREQIEKVIVGKDAIQLIAQLTAEEQEVTDLRKLIDEMSLPERLKLAMFGNKQCRSILIFDSNRIIQEAVLKNPRLQQLEVDEMVKSTTLSEGVFRGISKNKEWMRNYSIKRALVLNPKAPLDITLRWVPYLNSRDIKEIARSKNLPQVLVNEARKRQQDAQ